MGFLIKNGDELFAQGMDLIGRKDFGAARNKFASAIEKGCGEKENYARFAIAMADISSNMGASGAYQNLIRALGPMPSGSITFGVTSADKDRLIANANAAIAEINARGMPDNDYMAKGQAYIEVAGRFAGEFGEENLPIVEMLRGTAVTGMKSSLTLQAEAYEIMGKGAVYLNPKQGSEYLQMAYNFRKQLGESGQQDLDLMRNFSVTAKCWLCGKQVAGMGVHFMAVPTSISPMFREKENKEAIRSSATDFGSLYMCMPCYTAISNRADEIARPYYNECMAAIAVLQAEVASLQAQIAFARR